MDSKLPEISRIFDRVAARDRESLQEFITRYAPLIQRRIRGLLAASGIAAEDFDDILSSARRRADEAMIAHRIAAGCPESLKSFILGIAERRAHEAARREHRYREVLKEFAAPLAETVTPGSGREALIEVLVARLKTDDREIIRLRAHGASHEEIARKLGVTLAAYRKRWSRLRTKLLQQFSHAIPE